MFNIDSYIKNYILVEILKLFQEKNLLYKLMNEGCAFSFVLSEKLKLYFDFLVYEGILRTSNETYFFSENFSENFKRNGYGKFLVFLGYKDFFNFSNNNFSKKDNEKVANGSYIISKPLYENFFEKYLSENEYNSLLDLGCGNAEFLIYLAKKFPEKTFYGIELNNESFKKGIKNIEKEGINNIILYNDNIFNIIQIDIGKVDIVTSFFVLHELLNYDINEVLKNIIKKVSPKAFIVKEFTPPENIFDEKNKDLDQFFTIYFFIHTLTNQNTISISEWEKMFEKHGYKKRIIHHTQKYDNNNSMYPLMEFIH